MATAFGEVNVANETPLMFSRSSSLGSLSSLDQQAALNVHNLAHSQHTSGAVSPSDLPDSPSQTMPPSPRGRSPVFRLPPCTKPIPQPVGGVFQDCPRSFAEEGTPCRISQATSLSSLTLDDDASSIDRDGHEAFGEYKKGFAESAFYARDHGQGRARAPSCRVAGIGEAAEEVFADTTRRYAQEGTPCGYSRAESPCSLINDSSFPQSGGSDWEDDFEARPNRLKQPALFGSGRGRRWSGERSKSHVAHKHVSFNDDCVMRTSHEDAAVPYFADDCVRVYCTEGTPSVLSHAPSLTDLGGTKAWTSTPGPTEHALERSSEGHQTDTQRSGQGDVKPQGCHKHVSFEDDCPLGSPHKAVSPSFEEDCLRVYCTEDTPSVLSHSASFTDLSIGPDESKNWADQSPKPPCIKSEALIDVSDEEEGSADLIKQCIQLGWQVTQSSHPKTRSWSGAPEESIIINAPIPKPRSLIGAAGSPVTGQSCLPPSHVFCPSRLQCGNQDGGHIGASPLQFKGTSSAQSSSSSNLVAESSLHPALSWKSSSFNDVSELNGHQGSTSKDICECAADREFDLDGCAAASDSVHGGLAQERPLCQESSDEEDDVQLLQEVVMMGRALVGKPELLSPATSQSTNFPEVLSRKELCPHCPPADMGSSPVTSPLRAPLSVAGVRCGTVSAGAIAKEHFVEQPSPTHSSSPESRACTLPIKDSCVSESSDEEQDSKILLEVISLGRAMVGKQQHRSGKGSELVSEEPREKVCSSQEATSPLLFADGCCGGVLSAPDVFTNGEHCLGDDIVPDANGCLLQDEEDDDDDNEDDEKLLKEVVMLGLSSMHTMAALKLPQLDEKSEATPVEGTSVKANSVAVLVTEEVPRAEKIEEVSSKRSQEVSAIVPKAAADLKEEHKAKPAVPPEPPADCLDRIVQIRLKLPNGRSLTRRFLASAELGVLLVYLDSLGYPLTRFKIIKNWRRQELATVNPKQTLEQLKLYPKKTLTIKER